MRSVDISVGESVVSLPHGVLEELWQDVIQRQRDEREASCYVSVDPHPGRVTVLVLAETSIEHQEHFSQC